MHSTPAYITGQWQPAVFFSQIPFGLTQVEHMAWMNHGGGQELQHEAFREIFGVVPFTCGQTGIQMAGWFNKEINNIEDLRGITMRMPGLGDLPGIAIGCAGRNRTSGTMARYGFGLLSARQVLLCTGFPRAKLGR